MPQFVPTDKERAVVKLLSEYAYAQRRIAKLISKRRGTTIDEKTLRKVFADEIERGATELDLIALAMLGAAVRRGEPWAIQKHIDQRMWTAERGGWRPGGVKLGITVESAAPGCN